MYLPKFIVQYLYFNLQPGDKVDSENDLWEN